MAPLLPRSAGGGRVEPLPDGTGWRLYLPPGGRGYRLAQLDDYQNLPRTRFPWHPPVSMKLEARIHPPNPPGTWGFGFWNDPFVFLGGAGKRFPTGPQAVWFFGASSPNWLSLHPAVPARGHFAGVTTWRGPKYAWFFLPWVGLAAWFSPLRSWARQRISAWMVQWGHSLSIDTTLWHRYTLHWDAHEVRFWVDEHLVGRSPYSPRAPLGFVLWVDNQFASWPPHASPSWGTLEVPHEIILEVRHLQILKPLPT